MKHSKPKAQRTADDISVVPSGEENPGRETEVDAEDERSALFGPEKDEDIGLAAEASLHVPLRRERANRDGSPLAESDGRGLGMVDRPDSETLADYEQAARRDRRGA